jgi:hypothetical protein
VKAHKHSHHRLAETFRHSLRDGVTVSFVVSSVSRALLPPSMPAVTGKLDTSVGVSGRHDFAVRDSAARLAALCASIASRAPRS